MDRFHVLPPVISWSLFDRLKVEHRSIAALPRRLAPEKDNRPGGYLTLSSTAPAIYFTQFELVYPNKLVTPRSLFRRPI
jgi:hypothetical protein